jgi:hypothetical protein
MVGIVEDKSCKILKLKHPALIPCDLVDNPLDQSLLHRYLQFHQHRLS